MAFRFAYGIYYQYPNYYVAYQGINEEESFYPNYSLTEVNQIGYGNLDPERTTSYEVGLQTALNSKVSMNITAFYRDMSDLVGLKTIYGPRTYQLFTNNAYGISKGVELSVKAKVSNNFNILLNYTYSNVNASKQSTWYVPLFPQNRTFTADWDIPHAFSFSLDYLSRSQFGVSVIGNMSSGYPYSPSDFHPNSERGPMQKNLDVNIFKNFTLFGFKQTIFMHITNVFNERNIYWVYSDTGKPGEDANEGTSFDYTNDPTAWGPARHIRIGISLGF
jgi:outer membrane receptor protein involved in Fe transport